MGSPASIGISRFDTLNDLFFGEREAIRLAFDQSGVMLLAQAAPHDSAATAQDLGAARPGRAEHAGRQALRTPGSRSPFRPWRWSARSDSTATGHSRSDWYSFAGHAGDIMSFETISNVLPGNGRPLDTILRVYDSAGNLLASNDDELESRDSLDLRSSRFRPTASTSCRSTPSPRTPPRIPLQGDYVLYMTSFKIGAERGRRQHAGRRAGQRRPVRRPGEQSVPAGSGLTGPVTVIGGNGADILDRSASSQTRSQSSPRRATRPSRKCSARRPPSSSRPGCRARPYPREGCSTSPRRSPTRTIGHLLAGPGRPQHQSR